MGGYYGYGCCGPKINCCYNRCCNPCGYGYGYGGYGYGGYGYGGYGYGGYGGCGCGYGYGGGYY